MSEGVIYVAEGRYVEEAILSAKSIINTNPGLSITLFTDEYKKKGPFDQVIASDHIKGGMGNQIYALTKTPYQKTLYLDSDIYATRNIEELFELLDAYDVAMAPTLGGLYSKSESVPDPYPEYNSGVLLYNNNTVVKHMVKNWQKLYEERGDTYNQPSLREVLYRSKVTVVPLPQTYNCRWPMMGYVTGRVKLFHGRLIEFNENIPGMNTSMDFEQAIEKINSVPWSRIFVNTGDNIEMFEYKRPTK